MEYETTSNIRSEIVQNRSSKTIKSFLLASICLRIGVLNTYSPGVNSIPLNLFCHNSLSRYAGAIVLLANYLFLDRIPELVMTKENFTRFDSHSSRISFNIV